MISANIPNIIRKEVYRRDGFRCALCDGTDGLQVHHVVRRGKGGTDYPHNLITLCWRCHAVAHGTMLPEYVGVQPADIVQSCIEYLADYYMENYDMLWNPWEEHMQKIDQTLPFERGG